MLIFMSVIWLLFTLVAIYLFKLRRMNIYEFIASVLVLSGGSLMVLMGKTMLGYVGCGVFSFGSLLQIIVISKSKGVKKKK